MEQLQYCKWPGGKGSYYSFEVYPLNVNIDPKAEGNYIFAKQTITGWDAIYIGEGNLKDRTDSHKNEALVTKKGATHIHLRRDSSYPSRFSVETDLLAGNPEAYRPKGCNVKKGG